MSEMLGTFFKYLFALLGVAAVLAVLSQVVASNKDGLFVSQLTQAVGNIQQLYAGQSTFSGIVLVNLEYAQAFPVGMLNASGAPINPWGGTVTVAADANSTSFDITTDNVPQPDCARLLTSITTFQSVTVNSGTAVQAPADAGTLAAQCNAATNTVTFAFQG
jgi:hypothetical protein